MVYTQTSMTCMQTHTYQHTDSWHNYVSSHRSLAMANTFIRPSHSWAPVPNTSSVPSQHAFLNQLTFISLLCSSMGLYGPFSLHKTHLCPPQTLSWRVNLHFFFCKEILWCVDVSTGNDVVQGSQTTLHASGVTDPLLFCILCNLTCQLGKIDGSKIFKSNKSKTKVRTHMFKFRASWPTTDSSSWWK